MIDFPLYIFQLYSQGVEGFLPPPTPIATCVPAVATSVVCLASTFGIRSCHTHSFIKTKCVFFCVSYPKLTF